MIIVLSPAKSLDYQTPAQTKSHTLPIFIDEAAELVGRLRELSAADLSDLMGVSQALAELNVERYAQWSTKFTAQNAKQALLAFNGDVYEGLQAPTLSADDLAYAQDHLRILSGLYGVLRPLDWMQPYRLEMGTHLTTPRGKNLYAFWGELITHALNTQLEQNGATASVINLASVEYFKSVKPKQLKASVITPVFEDGQQGQYKVISFYAKRARGLMARYAILNRLDNPQQLQGFDAEGYTFAPQVSDASRWVFRRDTPPAGKK